MQSFHRLVALGVQKIRGWEGSVWDNRHASVVRLFTPSAIVEKIAYVLANPVAAGLVRRAHEWPGVKVCVSGIGRTTLCARRPGVYFNIKKTPWPDEACLPITLPPSVEEEHAESFRRQVNEDLERQEAIAHADMRQQGRRFLGAEKARAISPYARATSAETQRGRNPTYAVGRDQGVAWRAAATTIRTFRASYRLAIARWRTGMRDAAFPAGTWWMRVFHGAAISHGVAMAA
jgi:putative transposase